MATTLLEALQAQKQKQAAAPAPGTTDLTRKLLLAKSGKAGAAGGGQPNISNLGEQAAIQQTNADLGQVEKQGQIADQAEAMATEGVQEAERAGRTSLGQQRQGNQLQLKMDTNRLFRDIEESGKKLDFEKDKAQLDQLSQNLRLQDQQYVDKLQHEGQKARLDNDLDFEKEYQKSQLGDLEDLYRTKLGVNNLLSAKERDLKKFMGTMDINDAIAIAKSNGKRAAIQQKWQGIGNAAEAGISMIKKDDAKGGAK